MCTHHSLGWHRHKSLILLFAATAGCFVGVCRCCWCCCRRSMWCAAVAASTAVAVSAPVVNAGVVSLLLLEFIGCCCCCSCPCCCSCFCLLKRALRFYGCVTRLFFTCCTLHTHTPLANPMTPRVLLRASAYSPFLSFL